MDVKNFYYYDQFDEMSDPRSINNYDFSAGTLSENTIVIPDSFVTKKSADAGLTFVFTPYPADVGETNDITVVLDTTGQKSTLSTSTGGGCIISTTPDLPLTESAAPGWTWTVQLTNFTGITDSTKEYGTQIGFGSMDPGPHPELTANWRTGGVLEIDAVIYDDTGDGTEVWYSDEIVLTGQDPTSTTLDLRMIRPLPPLADHIDFEYRLNGGAWTPIGTYLIPEADRPLQFSFPARFPYVSLEEDAMDSPFQVHSHHWFNNGTPGDPNDTVYNAWLFVDDPGQATYSAVSVNSAGYLVETDLIFNAAGGYWELPAAVFSDDFNDNSMNTTDWSASGSSVTESEGMLKVSQDATDNGGRVLSRAFQINPYAPIVVQRKATLHYVDNNFDGVFALLFGDNTDFTTWENDTLSVVVSHANHDTASAHGFYLGSQPARFDNTFPATSAIWDAPFEEKIVYDPVTGLAELYIDGVQKATKNLGALPSSATYLKVYLDAWGATTGHTNYSDDLSISQKYTGSPVHLSDDTPPAGTVTFNFTATKQSDSTTETVSQPITGYVQDFAANLLPTGDVTNPTPTFSWTGITNATSYGVELSDTNMNRIWNKYNIPPATSSVVYDGPPLENGKTYSYDVVSNIETDGMNNASFAQGSFIYTGATPTTIDFNGWVKTGPNWPSIDGMQPVVGATVNAVDMMGTFLSAGTSASDGSFTVAGIPSMTTFRLAIPTPAATTYVPVLSKVMQWNADIQALLPFTLFTPTQYDAFANTAGNGLIVGRVALESSPTTFLPGATIEAREYIPGDPPTLGATYPVTYTSGSATQDDGIYIVKNVPSGTMVQLTATLSGYTFAHNQAIIPAQAGFVSEESFFAAPVSTTHPEAAAIQSQFEASMARFNTGDFSQETGFAMYISSSYLDSGETKAQFVAEAQSEYNDGIRLSWTVQSITGAGDDAAMELTWGNGEIDTLYFHKESGVWLLYGNQKRFDVWANSGHEMYSANANPYWVSLLVEDPDPASGITASGVIVKGPGLPAEGVALYHDTSAGQWHSWSQNMYDPNLSPQWAAKPAVPLEYEFTISYNGGASTEIQLFQVKSFVDAAPLQASLTPVAGSTATRPLAFAWGSAGDGYRYGIELNDADGNRIWSVEDLTGTSVTYDGPTLGGGQYTYNVVTEDGYENRSMIFTSFDMPLLYPRTAVTSETGVIDNHPAWSPNGQKIAFTSDGSGVNNIWTVNRDGSGVAQLTTATGGFDAKYPSWSPDGTKIAYIWHDPDPNPVEGAFDGYFLYTMNSDGSNQTLHPLPPSATQDQADQFWEFEVKFTEWLDSDRIAFVSYGPEGGSFKLYSYRLSNGAVTQIVPSPEEANPMGDIYKISWNAASAKLAYDRWPIGIQTITDTGAGYEILDIPRASEMDTPSMAGWRPDGAKLAFVKDLYETSDIGIFDMTTQSSLTEGTTTDDEWPVWSPDGGSIAFVSDGKIWTMTIAPLILIKGDVNDDGFVTLDDAILALKVMTNLDSTGVSLKGDVNGDGKIGMAEVLYILQHASTLRE